MATEVALSSPAADFGVLLCGRLLLLPAPVRQPAEASGQAKADMRTGVFMDQDHLNSCISAFSHYHCSGLTFEKLVSAIVPFSQ